MDFINLEYFPKNKIYILLRKECLEQIIKSSLKKLSCKNYFELASWVNKQSGRKFNGGDIKYWLAGEKLDVRTGKVHPKFMPLWLVLKFAKLNNLKIDKLQKNTLSYRSGSSGLIINKPILPIRVTPELDSIVIHLFADGAAGDYTPSYTQKNKDPFDNFIKKLENCFGDFERSIYFTQGKHQIKFPKAITDILSAFYDISSYSTYESSIPLMISNRKDKRYKIACIASFIVDEGQVRDLIIVYSANKRLLYQMRRLILDCNYLCSDLKFNSTAKCYWLSLSNKSIEKFYDDLTTLSKELSTCNLSFKDENVRFIISRRKLKNPKDRAFTNQVVLDILKKGDYSATQISRMSGYAHSTITHTLQRLYNGKIVNRTLLGNKSYLWSL